MPPASPASHPRSGSPSFCVTVALNLYFRFCHLTFSASASGSRSFHPIKASSNGHIHYLSGLRLLLNTSQHCKSVRVFSVSWCFSLLSQHLNHLKNCHIGSSATTRGEFEVVLYILSCSTVNLEALQHTNSQPFIRLPLSIAGIPSILTNPATSND